MPAILSATASDIDRFRRIQEHACRRSRSGLTWIGSRVRSRVMDQARTHLGQLVGCCGSHQDSTGHGRVTPGDRQRSSPPSNEYDLPIAEHDPCSCVREELLQV